MAHFNPNSFWNNVLVQNETVEKYSIYSLSERWEVLHFGNEEFVQEYMGGRGEPM